jgi:hypothetical protein
MKKIIAILLTITAPIWIIPTIVVIGIKEGSADLYKILWGEE